MQQEPTTINDAQRIAPTPEQTFAARVKERREFLRMSQTQLAQHLRDYQGLDLDGTAITRLERGDRRVRLDEAVAIVTVLGMDLYEAIAPHPGDLDEQLERARAAVFNASYAEGFWRREYDAALTRANELQALVDQVAADQAALRERIAQGRADAEARGDLDALYGEGMWEVTDDGEHREEA